MDRGDRGNGEGFPIEIAHLRCRSKPTPMAETALSVGGEVVDNIVVESRRFGHPVGLAPTAC